MEQIQYFAQLVEMFERWLFSNIIVLNGIIIII